MPFLKRFHNHLGLPPNPPEWYRDRLLEELIELEEARGYVDRLSETADVLFVFSRAAHDGHPLRGLSRPALVRNLPAYAYMLGKYALRWRFYRAVAREVGYADWRRVREVVNPAKDWKLRAVAGRYGIDEEEFVRAGARLRRRCALLP